MPQRGNISSSIEKELSEEAIRLIRRSPCWRQVIMMIGGAIAINAGVSLSMIEFHSDSNHASSVQKEELVFIKESISHALDEIKEIRALLISILRDRGVQFPANPHPGGVVPGGGKKRNFKIYPPIATP